MRITDARGLMLRSAELERSISFYENVWGLERLQPWGGDGVFFKGTGSEPFVLGLLPGATRGIVSLRFALESTAAVDSAFVQLRSRVQILDEPGLLAIPGDYYGFHVADLDGTAVELSATASVDDATGSAPFRPERLSHFVLNSPDNVALKDFYIEQLGFKLADWYRGNLLFFLRCNQQHHCMGLERGDNSSLNHVAFHVANLDAMMRCVGRLANAGYEPLWGPGRHGPGGNCFCYFEDPNGYVVEFTSELIQIPEGEDWIPKEWVPGPDNANVWGTGGRTDRAIKLMAGH